MIIQWNQMRVVTLSSKAKKLTLLPGNNSVETSIWNQFRNEESVQKKLKLKHIVELEVVKKVEAKGPAGKVLGEKIEKAKDLNDLEPKEAAQIVKKTYNLQTLNKWLDESGKDSVRAVIHKQIEKVEKGHSAKESK